MPPLELSLLEIKPPNPPIIAPVIPKMKLATITNIPIASAIIPIRVVISPTKAPETGALSIFKAFRITIIPNPSMGKNNVRKPDAAPSPTSLAIKPAIKGGTTNNTVKNHSGRDSTPI